MPSRDLREGYVEYASGQCKHDVPHRENCEDAAVDLSWSPHHETTIFVDDTARPKGCFLDTTAVWTFSVSARAIVAEAGVMVYQDTVSSGPRGTLQRALTRLPTHISVSTQWEMSVVQDKVAGHEQLKFSTDKTLWIRTCSGSWGTCSQNNRIVSHIDKQIPPSGILTALTKPPALVYNVPSDTNNYPSCSSTYKCACVTDQIAKTSQTSDDPIRDHFELYLFPFLFMAACIGISMYQKRRVASAVRRTAQRARTAHRPEITSRSSSNNNSSNNNTASHTGVVLSVVSPQQQQQRQQQQQQQCVMAPTPMVVQATPVQMGYQPYPPQQQGVVLPVQSYGVQPMPVQAVVPVQPMQPAQLNQTTGTPVPIATAY